MITIVEQKYNQIPKYDKVDDFMYDIIALADKDGIESYYVELMYAEMSREGWETVNIPVEYVCIEIDEIEFVGAYNEFKDYCEHEIMKCELENLLTEDSYETLRKANKRHIEDIKLFNQKKVA